MPETETDIEKRNKYGMLCGIVGIFLLSLIHISEPTRPY